MIKNIEEKEFIYRRFQVKYRTYGIQNRFSADAKIVLYYSEHKSIYLNRDYMDKHKLESEIIKKSKEWIDDFFINVID